MKIGVAQINTTVGDLAGNQARILAAYQRGVAAGADLVVFPELTITGYPPRDLLLKKNFIAGNLAVLNELAAATGQTALLVGFVGENKKRPGREASNCAALLQHGKIAATRAKSLLPTYDVFDEDRYFEPATGNLPVPFGGGQIGLTICEDIWNDEDFWPERRYQHNPPLELAAAGARILLNISASPWSVGKDETRFRMLQSMAAKTKCAVVLCNQIGGNDELVFDGGSLVFNAAGELIAQAAMFAEDFLLVDTEAGATGQTHQTPSPPSDGGEGRGEEAVKISPLPNPLPAPFVTGRGNQRPLSGGAGFELRRMESTAAVQRRTFAEEQLVHDALVLGVRDYFQKCGFKSAVLGLSGGIDSALTACLAVTALGRENVRGVALPSQFSSAGSLADAQLLAERLGISFDVIPIQPAFATLKQNLQPVFAGRAEDTTEENLQARLRGVILMALSNKFGSLLLTTGNKSELAVGYCTLYGDMCGGLAVISDVPKTMVYRLAQWINRNGEIIPASTITKAPSAELRPNQTDQDTLPPYDVLDGILSAYIESGKSAAEIVASGHDEATVNRVIRLIESNEYKRRQAAPGLKVTSKAFGVGRRMPIARKGF